jgi:hypothetical protein
MNKITVTVYLNEGAKTFDVIEAARWPLTSEERARVATQLHEIAAELEQQ